MARITVEDCLEQEGNRFALVLLAAKRTKQILAGSSSIAGERKNKPVVSALREIAEGKVRFMNEEESKVAAEEEQRRLEEEGQRQAQQQQQQNGREQREQSGPPATGGASPAIALSLQSLMGIRPRPGTPSEADDDE